jgi:thiamine pyrophosphokinase
MGTVGSDADGIVAAVIIGGGPLRAPDDATARRFDVVVAADSGLDVALAAGLHPTHLVGDLDSISSAGSEWAAAHGVPIEQHPADKDATDTALALDRARRLGATEIVLFGGIGIDRFDHLLGTVAALGDHGLAGVPLLSAHLGASTLYVLHPGHEVSVDLLTGTVFSLVALHGDCTGVAVRGAQWPLDDADLPSGSTRGISNAAVDPSVRVSTATGVLTVVVPRPDPSPTLEQPQHTPQERT